MQLADRFDKSPLADGIRRALSESLERRKKETVALQNVAVERPDDIGEMMMMYVEVDNETKGPTGRSVSMLDVEFEPLQYADLLGKNLSGKVVIPLSWCNARVLESSISEIPADRIVSGNAVLESDSSSLTIGCREIGRASCRERV